MHFEKICCVWKKIDPAEAQKIGLAFHCWIIRSKNGHSESRLLYATFPISQVSDGVSPKPLNICDTIPRDNPTPALFEKRCERVKSRQILSTYIYLVVNCYGYMSWIYYVNRIYFILYIYIYISILNYLACTYQCQSVYLFLDVDILFVHMYCTYRSICKRTCRCVRVFCWLSEKNVSAQVDVNNICIGNIEYICRHIYVYVHVHSYLSM
jgi:hypothetical protein